MNRQIQTAGLRFNVVEEGPRAALMLMLCHSLAAMADMHGRVPGSRYVELPAAHLCNIECAATFNAALADFLRAQG